MNPMNKGLGLCALALAFSQPAIGGTAPYFTPLTHSEAVTNPNSIDELNAPWEAPQGLTQVNLTSLLEVETAEDGQTIGRAPAGSSSSMFDMLAYDPSGRYIFIPHESPIGAGVTRYDTEEDKAHLIFVGDTNGAGPDGSRATADDLWDTDFGAFDPARWTPNGTVIAAEEWSGLGRVIEIMDPWASPSDPVAGSPEMQEGTDWRVLTSIVSVSHEGINFSQKHHNKVIYFIDEDRSGSIYKLVLKTAGDYAGGGQTFVLVSQAFLDAGGDAAEEYRFEPNTNPGVKAARFGLSQWVPITDENGNPVQAIVDAGIDPFAPNVLACEVSGPEPGCRSEDIRPGRIAADIVGGTPFGRPEDMSIGSRNGNEMLYITATSENSVISIEETKAGPVVRLFVTGDDSENNADESGEATPTNLGLVATTGFLNSPDNLATDSLGNVFIIEDAPNSSSTGGDIWMARDMDNDGVAESIDHFLSLQVNGAEATGMIFHPTDPTRFVVAVQHPTSTGLGDDGDSFEEGDITVTTSEANDGVRDTIDNGPNAGQPVQDFGDALWEFDLSDVVPPVCNGQEERMKFINWVKEQRKWVGACSHSGDFNFVKQLKGAEEGGFPNP